MPLIDIIIIVLVLDYAHTKNRPANPPGFSGIIPFTPGVPEYSCIVPDLFYVIIMLVYIQEFFCFTSRNACMRVYTYTNFVGKKKHTCASVRVWQRNNENCMHYMCAVYRTYEDV